MPPDPKPPLELTLVNLSHQASIEAIFDFLVIIGDRLQIKDIDGLPLEKWLLKRKIEHMEAMLLKLEDVDPALAAKFQNSVDESRKSTGL